MNIRFYLCNQEETEITTFHGIPHNPFKIGDIISLDVEDIYPNDLKGSEALQTVIKEADKTLQSLFRMTKVIIVREYKEISIKATRDGNLTIEYFCEFVKDK